MQKTPLTEPRVSSAGPRAAFLAACLSVAGFGLTALFLYPGYLTNDATYIYSYIGDWSLGDWQSPLMTILWWLIDPISPGSGSMFLFVAGLYWLGFGLVAATVARRSALAAAAVPLLGLAPPAFMFLSMIWRDTLLAASWLVGAALVYFTADRSGPLRGVARSIALVLVGFGVLLRPNTILSAPLLFTYVAWPTRFEWRRAALAFAPLVVASYALVHLVYYEVLHAKHENPLHSLIVFDLGGITHFAQENQFPVTWSPDETALLLTQCYRPALWDTYWTLEPCKFVMARLERKDDPIFGTPRLVDAWIKAVTTHPLAYLEHRGTFLWDFLTKPNLTLELFKLALPDETPLAHNTYFNALLPLHDAIKSSILYRAGYWLVLAIAIGAWTWPARATSTGAFVLGSTGCAVFYILSYGVFGVATDLRYAYWGVLASLASLVPAMLARRHK